uniref:J domain-containing protein n=1 Tax=Phytophthora ramorum TaxID=164328 RepID=H3GHF5_PHYRM
METTTAVSRPAKKPRRNSENALPPKKHAWWWTDTSVASDPVASSETELLNAAVLCAALSATQSEPSESDTQASDRAVRELEMHVRKSPLPHSLQLPVLAFTRDYLLAQSELAVICAVRATKPADILQTVVGSAVPLSQPFVHRFGGARIHAPFWKRTQRLDLQDLHHQARLANKTLLLCGHSIGGSIAQLAFCELAYQHLPTKTRLFLEKRDYDKQKQEDAKENSMASADDGMDFRLMVQAMSDEEREAIACNAPRMLAIGFGAPYIGSTGLTSFLEPLGLMKRVITFVNEFDCIPSILNVAQSAAMVAKTTERLVTITKATKTLVNLLPIQMQQRFVNLAVNANTGTVPNASSAYLSMSLNILQNTFQKFRDFNIVKEIDYQYSPCGTYIFLAKSGAEYSIYADPASISKALHKEDDSNASLTGNAILQHLMSAYVNAIARRSNSIQINASMDFYERLGAPRNATERQIRSAYKRLALKWHPDRWANSTANPQEQASAEDIFKLLAEAYEVLSDAEARKAYDAHLNDSPSLKDEFNIDTTQLLLQQADERKKKKHASSLAITDSSSEANDSTAKQLFVRGAQQALVTLKQEEEAAEDELIEEFFDCATEYDNATTEAMAEEEFFECIDLMDEVAAHFSDGALEEEMREEKTKAQDIEIPVGSTFKSIVAASGDGALDSGIRAAGGVALANGMARTSSALGGAVAAPLTIASILVDVGKEYYDYRKRYTDRKSLGVLSTTTEQLMMQDFRLKTGEVIASRTAAAAGAGIGAYSVASALGMWSTAGLAAGPVGIVAATSAAVMGGMLGFFAGSKVYSASTAGYFTSQQNAKEHIDRLELGARILFDEFDPEASGAISKEDCIKLMKKLYDAMGSISESGYERTMAVIADDAFEGPVTWGMFWEWVSTEAARALRELEHEESKKMSEPVAGETWWNSYMSYFSYLNSKKATALLAEHHAPMYPSVRAGLGLAVIETALMSGDAELQTANASEVESLVLKAQVEFLVNNGHLTVGDAFQLREQLASDDPLLKESARKTISAMHEGLSDASPDQNLVCEGFGFTGGDAMNLPVDEPEKEKDARAPNAKSATSGGSNEDTEKAPEPDERLDVMCSLMSTQGLQHFLQRQNILVPAGDEEPVQHEELHCLALMAAAPTPKS